MSYSHPDPLIRATIEVAEIEKQLAESGGDVTSEEQEEAFMQLLEERAGVLSDVHEHLDYLVWMWKVVDDRADRRLDEKKRMNHRRRVDLNRVGRLKSRIVEVLQLAGQKTIETDDHRITLAKAGGKQPMDIVVEDLPDPYCQSKITLTLDLGLVPTEDRERLYDVIDAITPDEDDPSRPAVQVEREVIPLEDVIRQALKAGADVRGARLLPRTLYPRIS